MNLLSRLFLKTAGFVTFFGLLAIPAWAFDGDGANPVMAISADHGDLLYTAGQQANFVVLLVAAPVNPRFRLMISVSQSGSAVSSPILLSEDGTAVFTTPVLSTGSKSYTFTASLVDESATTASIEQVAPKEDRVVDSISLEQQTFYLTTNPAP